MIKKLLLTAALLAPGLAYGQVSAPLDPPVVPAGQVPAPAAAAGFTANVLKADFTTSGNFWSNTANYLINCGAAASVPNQPSTWHFDYRVYQTETTLPCSRTVITTDTGGGGNQALELILTTADYAANVSGNPPQTNGYLSFPSHVTGASTTPWLPNEMYTKVVYREDSSSFNQGVSQGHTVYGADTWWSQSITFGAAYLDEDYAELAPFTPNSCSSSSGAFFGKLWEGPTNNLSSQVCSTLSDFTQYHALETLITSNENTDITLCEWLDGTLTGCTIRPFSLVNNNGFAYTKHDRSVFMSNGVIPAVTAINNDLHVFIKSIEIWSCPNFATQTCPGTIVDHWPFP
jgi:hypothetical protein